jgi:hypothetical protein
MVVVFHREVSTVARGNRNLDAVLPTRCRDAERTMSLTERVAASEVRHDSQDYVSAIMGIS